MTPIGDLTQLHWSHPYGWLLALQPLVMAALSRLRPSRAARYADPGLRPWAVWQDSRPTVRVGRRIAGLLAWILLACAAAGPRQPLSAASAPGESGTADHVMDVMVVLDVDAGGGAAPLERARLRLLDLLPRLRGERLGLVVYGNGAGLLMPLNGDYHAFRYYLGLAKPSLFKAGAGDLAGALALARRRLRQSGAASKAVLLLTPGLSGNAGAALPSAIAALHSKHIPLYVLDTAGTRSSLAPVLARDAALTGGRLVRDADRRPVWRVLYHQGIGELPGKALPPPAGAAWESLFAWFLAPALVLLWALHLPAGIGRRHAAGMAHVLCTVVLLAAAGPRPAAAAGDGAAQAYKAYQSHQFALAQAIYAQLPGYRGRMGEGASAYRLDAYPYAIRQFTAALLRARTRHQRADALFDLGNSEYRAGHYRAAADAFLGVLRYRQDRRARANLALAARQLGGLIGTGKYTLSILALRGQPRGQTPSDTAGGAASAPGKTDQPLPLTALHDRGHDYTRARPRPTGKGSSVSPFHEAGNAVQFYRAALKKLALVQDRAERLQKALLGLDSTGAGGARR